MHFLFARVLYTFVLKDSIRISHNYTNIFSLVSVIRIYEAVNPIPYNLIALHSRLSPVLLSCSKTAPADNDPFFSPKATPVRYMFCFRLQTTGRSRS